MGVSICLGWSMGYPNVRLHRANDSIADMPENEVKIRKVSKQRHGCSTCLKHFTTKWDCLQHIKNLRDGGANAIYCLETGTTVRIDSFFSYLDNNFAVIGLERCRARPLLVTLNQ